MVGTFAMSRRVAPRVPGSVRGDQVVRVTASAALLASLLTGPPLGVAADRRLQNVFTSAADEYHVPRSVLMGVSYLLSRWDSHPGAPSASGGYGPMHLVDAREAPAPAAPHRGSALPLRASAELSASREANSSDSRS